MKPISTGRTRAALSFILAILLLVSDTGCKYFRTRYVIPEKTPYLKELSQLGKYFVVHDAEGNTFQINNIEFDSLSLSGVLNPLQKKIYYTPERSTRYKNFEYSVVNEAHIYLKKEAGIIAEGNFKTPLNTVSEIRILDKNTGKEIAIWVLGGVAATAVIIGAFLLLVAATKSSCPFVYASDGETFVLQGETFGGAFNPNTEREDYLPLPALKMEGSKYKIRITNELKERQYTDFAHLLAVPYDGEGSVLLDEMGRPFLIKNPKSPASVFAASGETPSEIFADTDNKFYFFNDESQPRNDLVLKFEKPAAAQSGRLVLNAKNSFWLDILYGRFTQKFGAYYQKWTEKQAELPREIQIADIENHGFPLSVYIKKSGQWELVQRIPTVGPVAARDFVIPLEFENGSNDTEVEIKLSTGFMFWELDKAVIDFSEQIPLQVERLKPATVTSSDKKDYLKTLSASDGIRMAQPNIGDMVEITYEAPARISAHKNCAVFLHTKGYYEPIRDYDGLPQISELQKFKEPGYFMKYSLDEFLNSMEIELANQ